MGIGYYYCAHAAFKCGLGQFFYYCAYFVYARFLARKVMIIRIVFNSILIIAAVYAQRTCAPGKAERCICIH